MIILILNYYLLLINLKNIKSRIEPPFMLKGAITSIITRLEALIKTID